MAYSEKVLDHYENPPSLVKGAATNIFLVAGGINSDSATAVDLVTEYSFSIHPAKLLRS